jgi:hypothetical protein
MELDPYLAGAAFLVPSQLVVSGRAIPSKPLDMWSVNRDLCGKSPKLVKSPAVLMVTRLDV